MLDFNLDRFEAAWALRAMIIHLGTPVVCWALLGLASGLLFWKLNWKRFSIAVLLVCVALPVAWGLLAFAYFHQIGKVVPVTLDSWIFLGMLAFAQIAAAAGLMIYHAPPYRLYGDKEAARKRLSAPH